MRYLAAQTGDTASEEHPYIRLHPDQLKYWRATTPEQRGEIAEFIVSTAAERNATLSLRMLRDTVRFYVSQHEHNYSLDWRDKVIKELTQCDTNYQFSAPPSRKDERLTSERRWLNDLLDDASDFLECGWPYQKATVQAIWCDMTGANDRQFRRRLAEKYPRDYEVFMIASKMEGRDELSNCPNTKVIGQLDAGRRRRAMATRLQKRNIRL